MRDVLRPVLGAFEADLVEVDIRQRPELLGRYAREIPVLLLEGRELARHRATADELRRKLADAGVVSARSGT